MTSSAAPASPRPAITGGAAAGQGWPWIAQLGQGRGGFCSYAFLGNPIGGGMHSAAQIAPGWPGVEVTGGTSPAGCACRARPALARCPLDDLVRQAFGPEQDQAARGRAPGPAVPVATDG